MLRRLFFFASICCAQIALGQANPFMKDVNGRPLYLRITYVPDGTPYLEDAYRPADITTTNNKTYTGIKIKVNLMENDVQFLSPAGEEMVAMMPIKRIRFHKTEKLGAANNMILESISAINERGAKIYAVLDSGRVSLLKHLKVVFRDDRRYNEATITRVFSHTPVYYAYKEQREARIEKNKDFILQLFQDKRKEVERFINEHNLKCKSEDDLISVFHYYNSLF